MGAERMVPRSSRNMCVAGVSERGTGVSRYKSNSEHAR